MKIINNFPERILITGGSGFIGTHLINHYKINYPNYEILNLSTKKPMTENLNKYWINCDIKNADKIRSHFLAFKPTSVIHLAAKANLNGKTIEDFPDNTKGTKNIVKLISQTFSVNKFIHTSTQYVCKPGQYPNSDIDFNPYTAYGASKAESERIVIKENLKCKWIIIRPTNIWGPWHPVFPYGLWKYLSKGYYFHPGKKPIIKHYGFVGNAVNQIVYLLEFIDKCIDGKVYYITDPPIDNSEWMNAFSIALRGKPIVKIPRSLWKILGFSGDIFNLIGFNSPISSARYFRLTVDEKIPFQKTINIAGKPQYTLEQGVQICIDWIHNYFPHLLRK